MPERDVSASARIAASPERLYGMVSDVTKMGDWSPENLGGRWLGHTAAPVVGARFRGSNRWGWRRWSTKCTVRVANPPHDFAFDVAFNGIPASRWSYHFEADDDATVVTETWRDRRPGWFALVAGATMGIRDLRAHNLENIQRTLTNLAAAAEG